MKIKKKSCWAAANEKSVRRRTLWFNSGSVRPECASFPHAFNFIRPLFLPLWNRSYQGLPQISFTSLNLSKLCWAKQQQQFHIELRVHSASRLNMFLQLNCWKPPRLSRCREGLIIPAEQLNKNYFSEGKKYQEKEHVRDTNMNPAQRWLYN